MTMHFGDDNWNNQRDDGLESKLNFSDISIRRISSFDREKIEDVLKRRLTFAHWRMGISEDSVITMTPSAVERIFQISGGRPGFALYLLHEALPSAIELLESVPFVIDSERVSKNIRSERQYEEWDSVGRELNVLNLGALEEGLDLSDETRALLPGAKRVIELFQTIIKFKL